MALYFFHLRDGHDELLDPDGIEASQETIAGLALRSARDCIARDAETGRIDLRFRIDVHDDKDAIVHSLAFEDAVSIIH